MKTDELVSLIAADDVADGRLMPKVLVAAAGMLVVFGGLAIALLGVRADLADAMVDPVTVMKWAIPLVLMVVGAGSAIRLTQPQILSLGYARGWLAAIMLGAFIWWLAQAIGVNPQQVAPRTMGGTAAVCLASIMVISAPALAVALYLLRAGASPSPTLSGAMAGLGVAGAATAIYALHCNEDAPLFFLLWYGLGISIVTAIGAWAGSRLLRW